MPTRATIPSDFTDLFPTHEAAHGSYDGPIYHLWVFDPMNGQVTITHNEDRPRAQAFTHDDFATEVTHPNRVSGYAYKIQGGYRITDDEHRKVEDPHIIQQVRRALNQETKHADSNS